MVPSVNLCLFFILDKKPKVTLKKTSSPSKGSTAKASGNLIVLTRGGVALIIFVIVLILLLIAFIALYVHEVLKPNGKATLTT